LLLFSQIKRYTNFFSLALLFFFFFQVFWLDFCFLLYFLQNSLFFSSLYRLAYIVCITTLIWWSLQSSYCHNVLVSVSTFLDFWKIGIIFIVFLSSIFLLVLLHKKWGEKERKNILLGPSILNKSCRGQFRQLKIKINVQRWWSELKWEGKLSNEFRRN